MSDTTTTAVLPGMTTGEANPNKALVSALAATLGVNLGPDLEAVRAIVQAEVAKLRKQQPRKVMIISPIETKDMGERIVHPLFQSVLQTTAVGLAPMVFGPAGSGKTTLAEQVAEALNLPFYFSGAVSKKHELFGYNDANGATVKTAFRVAFETGGLFLFDEVDASSPNILLTVNAALGNGYCDFPDGRIKAHKDFRFFAAANTNGGGATREYSGRYKLDDASLDRFVMFQCDYDDNLTAQLIGAYDMKDDLRAVALEWANRVIDFRKAMTDLNMRGVISPRCSLHGAKLIAAGFGLDQLEESLIMLKFGSPEDRRRLRSKANEITKARKGS